MYTHSFSDNLIKFILWLWQAKELKDAHLRASSLEHAMAGLAGAFQEERQRMEHASQRQLERAEQDNENLYR